VEPRTSLRLAQGRAEAERQPRAHHQYVYADKRRDGTLYRRLRCQKKRRKRYGSRDRRGQLQGCKSITERPPVVETRRRVGDREANTIIGQQRQQVIVSLVERKSKLTLLAKVERNTAEADVRRVMDRLNNRPRTRP
jgi:IS30 family transposase